MAASKRFVIADFSHRVAICSMQDVVDTAGTMSLRREDVYHAWANIAVSASSTFGKDGQVVKQSRDARTHRITVRMRRDLDITVAAWLYDKRLQSPSRWFKILSYEETGESGEYLTFDCRLVQRAADAVEPAAPVASCEPSVAMPMPQGVVL